MPVVHEEKDRRVIPRWRSLQETIKRGELQPFNIRNEPLIIGRNDLEFRRKDFKENRSLSFAADLISVAVSSGQKEEAKEAAHFVLKEKNTPFTLKNIAEYVLGSLEKQVEPDNIIDVESHKVRLYKEIHDTKIRIFNEPRNAFLWVRIAQLYSNVGVKDKATKALGNACWLEPYNRYVLRSTARFFIHIDDYKRAHDILRNSPLVRHDPWLLSAEIAVATAARRTSRNIKSGRNIIESQKFDSLHISELASAIGTLEFEAGNTNKGKKHLIISLDSPTENVVAQTAWAIKHFSNLEIKNFDRFLNHSVSYEAKAFTNRKKARWKDTINESIDWLTDQPFSSRPAIFGSYISATALGDYEQSASIAKSGLVANPNNFTLLNNYIFSLAQINNIKEAEIAQDHLDDNSLSEKERLVWMATSGLVLYRKGEPERGKKLYMDALHKAEKVMNKYEYAIAYLWFALEELRLNTPESEKIRSKAIEVSRNIAFVDLVPLLKRVKKFKQI